MSETMPLMVQGTSALALEPQPLSPDQYAEIALVEARKATEAALAAVTNAKAVKIESEDDYHAADKAMAGIKADMKRFDGTRDGLVRPSIPPSRYPTPSSRRRKRPSTEKPWGVTGPR